MRLAEIIRRSVSFVIVLLAPVAASAQAGPYEMTRVEAVGSTPAAQVTEIKSADDHFLCYKGKVSKGSTSADGVYVISLDDTFGQPASFDLRKERGSCNPADKNDEGIVDADTHLTSYQIKRRKGEAKFVKPLNVRMVDQFGEIYLDAKKEDRLLVPASKDDGAENPLPDPPIAANHNVDHYKCYKAKEAKGSTKFPGVQVSIEDQWETPGKLYDLKKPRLLCRAADKNGEGIKNDNADMICYQARPVKGEPKHEKRFDVGFGDQFIQHRLDSKSEELLCVPALEDPPAEYCGDGIINQAPEEECDGDTSPCMAGQNCVDCQCVTPPYCGDGNLDAGEQCESSGDCLAGEACTGACTCIDEQCPSIVEWTRFASAGVMTTGSDFNSGYTGLSHSNSTIDLARLRFHVASVSGSGPASCGVATIAGFDPASRMCRCQNDYRQICDQPLQADIDDCGGDLCECHTAPPASILAGGFPGCALTRLASDVTGTWNLDTGSGEIALPVIESGNSGESLLMPCPTCDGDITLNDGVRDGTCNGGLDHGSSCDAQGNHQTFPAPGGGGASLDCWAGGPLITTGSIVTHNYTTGSTTLETGVGCGESDSLLCHCGVCDTDDDTPCASNADCGQNGPCRSVGAVQPLPNTCTDGVCTLTDPGHGRCFANQPTLYCDQLLRADGGGLIGCISNADCKPPALVLDAGNCTVQEYRPCFPDTIAVTGTASPTDPFVVSADCTGPSNNPGVNVAVGYPGPAVLLEQLSVSLPCAGDPGSTYPGCP